MEPTHAIAAAVGFTSLALLWLALIAGLALARGWMMTQFKHATMLAIHHSLALLGLTLGIVHGVAQIVAPAQTVKLIHTFVPFTNSVDPVGIGLGVVGTEVMIALILSVGIQKWLGFHRWRAVHALAYASYTLVTGHVLISGSEVESWYMQAAVLAPWLVLIGLWLIGGSKSTSASSASRYESSQNGTSQIADRVTTRLRGKMTTLQVNPSKCARFGFCEAEAPDLFNLRDDGQLAYRAVVADSQLDAAQRATRACPARAILLSKGANGSGGAALGAQPAEAASGAEQPPTGRR